MILSELGDNPILSDLIKIYVGYLTSLWLILRCNAIESLRAISILHSDHKFLDQNKKGSSYLKSLFGMGKGAKKGCSRAIWYE